MSRKRYSTSFKTGNGLFSRESVNLASLYMELGDWNVVRDKVVSENLLQFRTQNTLKRFCSEVISRLKTLSFDELRLLVETNPREQRYLLWIALCRRYSFIADFAIEVLRERYISLKFNLNYEDFDSFFNSKSEWHPELDRVHPRTRASVRQVLFRILREADLLTVDNVINAAMLSPRLLEAMPRGKRRDLLFFPAFEADLRQVAQ
ncbi:MAG: DUF1819 family protein [Candidatus Dadabacteria bacterium]|nr:DUF1819 family protein [Candidatus Dadabacteria bacterium]